MAASTGNNVDVEDEANLEAATSEQLALHTPIPGEDVTAKALEAQHKALAQAQLHLQKEHDSLAARHDRWATTIELNRSR